MAISNASNKISYTANGVQTAFTFPYAYYNQSHLLVYVNSVLQTLGSTYTVNPTTANPGDGNPVGGTVTFLTAPANLAVVQIVRVLPLSQGIVLNDGGNFPAKTIEKEYDEITMMLQQQSEQIGRAMLIPVSETATLTLPAVADRASKFLAFDAGGLPIAATTLTGTPVTGFMATVLDDTDAASARATLLVERDLEIINVKDHGALGNGVANDTAAVQAAADSIAANGAVLYFPRGTYNIDATLTLPAGKKIYMLGAGKRNSVIMWVGGNNDVMLDLNNVEQGFVMQGFWFTKSAAQTGITGVLGGGALERGTHAMRDVLFDNIAVGLDGGSSRGVGEFTWFDSVMINVDFTSCGIGYDAYGSAVSMFGGSFRSCTTAAVRLNYLNVNNSAGFFCQGAIFAANTRDIRVTGDIRRCVFQSTWFENASSKLLDATAGTINQGLSFADCLLSTAGGAAALLDLTNLTSGSLRVHHCAIDGAGSQIITIPAAIEHRISENHNTAGAKLPDRWSWSSVSPQSVYTTLIGNLAINTRTGDINRFYNAATLTDLPNFAVPAGKTMKVLSAELRCTTGGVAGTYTVKGQLRNVGAGTYQDLATISTTALGAASYAFAKGDEFAPLASLAAGSVWNIVIFNGAGSPAAVADCFLVITYVYD